MTLLSTVPRRTLGRTGLEVSILGFGTAPLGDLYARLDDRTAIAAVKRAFEVGINLLDTSPLYGRGLAEHRCGTAMRRTSRRDIVVCTKVGRWMDPFHQPDNGSGFVGGSPHRATIDYSYDGTMRSVEQSLLSFGIDRLDLLLIHDVDVWTHGTDAIEDRFREAMEGAYVALDKLRAEGVVAGIGIGVNEAEMCVRFAKAGSFEYHAACWSLFALGATSAVGVSAAGAKTGNRRTAWWRIQFRHSGNWSNTWCEI
jgi:D-threo-aldose 1-dehydrogenase